MWGMKRISCVPHAHTHFPVKLYTWTTQSEWASALWWFGARHLDASLCLHTSPHVNESDLDDRIFINTFRVWLPVCSTWWCTSALTETHVSVFHLWSCVFAAESAVVNASLQRFLWFCPFLEWFLDDFLSGYFAVMCQKSGHIFIFVPHCIFVWWTSELSLVNTEGCVSHVLPSPSLKQTLILWGKLNGILYFPFQLLHTAGLCMFLWKNTYL